MKKLIAGSLFSVLASAGLVVAQAPTTNGTPPGDPQKTEVAVPLAPPSPNGEGCGPLVPHWHDIVEPDCQWYGGAEYLLFWAKRGPSDTPLVTSGSLSDPFPGALGQPNTKILLNSGSPFDYDATSGARMTLGYWLDRQGCFGIEGTGFVMEQRSSVNQFGSNGSGSPLLGVPFFNANLGRQDFEDIAIPLIAPGFVNVTSTSQAYGFEVNGVGNLYRTECWNVNFVGGFRWFGLDERLTISDATSAAPGFSSLYLNTAFPPPAITDNFDSFGVHNHFYGGQIGGQVDYKSGNLLFCVVGKIAFGGDHEEEDVNGTGSLHVGPIGPVSTTPGGLFAGPNNSGHSSDNAFAVLPEVDLKIGYQFTPHVSAFVGWTFMYLSDVIRPGDQIDPSVNPNRVPTFLEFGQPGGAPNPLPQFNHTDYWITGVNVGIEVKF